jgi:hypothetical protein
MYITRFVRVDASVNEEYYYRSAEESICHLKLFCDDDSGLYERIEAIDESTGNVLMTLPFYGGVAGVLTVR